jgi:hypothetical protein
VAAYKPLSPACGGDIKVLIGCVIELNFTNGTLIS